MSIFGLSQAIAIHSDSDLVKSAVIAVIKCWPTFFPFLIIIFSDIQSYFNSAYNFVQFYVSVFLENIVGFLIYDANTVAIRIRITISDGFPLYIWIRTIKVIYNAKFEVQISIDLLYKKRAVPSKLKTPAVINTALLSNTLPVWS